MYANHVTFLVKLSEYISQWQQGAIAEAVHNQGTRQADNLKALSGKVPEQLGCQTSSLFTLQLNVVVCYCPFVSRIFFAF